MHIKLLLCFVFCVPFVLSGNEFPSEYIVEEATYTYKPLDGQELEPLVFRMSKHKLVLCVAKSVAVEADGSLLGVSFNLNTPPRVSIETNGAVSLLSTSIKGSRSGKSDFFPVSVWLYSFVNEGLHYVSIRPLYEASSEVTWVDLVTSEKSDEIPSRLEDFLDTIRTEKLGNQKPVDPFK